MHPETCPKPASLSHSIREGLVTVASLIDPHNLGMLFKLPEDLLTQGISDLGVNAGVLNVLVAEVVGYILDPTAGFQEMDGNRVAESMDRSAGNAHSLCVGLEEMLHHPFLERALPSGEKVGACIVAWLWIDKSRQNSYFG
jgi:hypothetical protein